MHTDKPAQAEILDTKGGADAVRLLKRGFSLNPLSGFFKQAVRQAQSQRVSRPVTRAMPGARCPPLKRGHPFV